jgi:hypothetical protein
MTSYLPISLIPSKRMTKSYAAEPLPDSILLTILSMRVIFDHAANGGAVGIKFFLPHQQETRAYLGHYLRGREYLLHFSLFPYLLRLHFIPADVDDGRQ